jgi:ABC-type sugar transport system permease subunit
MPALRIIKREWKAILIGAVLLGALLFLLYQIYCGWAYGRMRSLPLLTNLYDLYCKSIIDGGCVGLPAYTSLISFSGRPILFLINLAVFILMAMIVTVFLGVAFWSWRMEQRNLQRRESRPPLDTSIRESIDL